MTRNDAIKIARKLKALAEKAEGGERDVAREKLKSFCKKHNLDEEEYATETIKVSIGFSNEAERILLSNILCMILETDVVKGSILNNVYRFNCTPRQYELIRDAFGYYRKILSDYTDSFLTALVSKYRIGNTASNTQDDFSFDPMSDEEKKQYDEEFEKNKEEEPQPNEEPPKSSPPPPAPEEEAKKTDRVHKMMFVIDIEPWKPKPKAKLFLS